MQFTNRATIGTIALSLITMLGLAACAGTTPEQKQKAAEAKTLTGAELQTIIVGNTLSGKSRKGPSYVEFYDTNGQIRGLWAGTDKYDGSWTIKGDTFCTDYEGTEDDGCSPMSINGSEVYWLKADGTVYDAGRPAKLIAGNSNGL